CFGAPDNARAKSAHILASRIFFIMVLPFRMIYYYLYTVIYTPRAKNQMAMIFSQYPENSLSTLDFF
ncbi:MAG: hypothetical protein IKK25_05060, partial [Lentisphaeria bacterium]|nr:hypothetical protein [Lentisphaeria bacterium]